MDKPVRPFLSGAHVAPEPGGIACMSYVWDHKGGRWGRGAVRTIGVRKNLSASSWTHALTEVTWMGRVAYLEQPASSDEEVEARHEELVAHLQSLPWPGGFEEAVRRWSVGPIGRVLP